MPRVAVVTVAMVVLAVLGAAGWAVRPHERKPLHDVTVTGTLSCAACKLGGSPDHKCGRECCMQCIGGGDSAVLEDDRGSLYLMISKDKGGPVISPEREGLIGEEVEVTGVLLEKGGLKGIYVESVARAANAAGAIKEKTQEMDKPVDGPIRQ